MSLHEEVEGLGDQLVSERRWLHSHAELSFREFETSAWIYERLKEMGGGLILSRPTPTSVMAVLRTGRPGPVLAVRADIDALPMTEESGEPFASLNPGVMHSCGHDGHAASLLSTVRLMLRRRESLTGEIRFIFQHAEETPPGGAQEVIAAGVLDGVDEVYGFHFTSTMPTGTFGICKGVMTSATDEFIITVNGKGGHSSMPEECVDPVVIGSEIILALQGIISRRLNPREIAVLSVCSVSAGTAYNVIPDTMVLDGSVRTFSEEVRENIKTQIRETAEGIAQSQGASAGFEYKYGYDSVVNDAALADRAEALVKKTFGEEAVVYLSPLMPGDDFCYYHRDHPGFFMEIGAGNSEKGTCEPHHNPKYRLDEDALPFAVEYLTALFTERLGK